MHRMHTFAPFTLGPDSVVASNIHLEPGIVLQRAVNHLNVKVVSPVNGQKFNCAGGVGVGELEGACNSLQVQIAKTVFDGERSFHVVQIDIGKPGVEVQKAQEIFNPDCAKLVFNSDFHAVRHFHNEAEAHFLPLQIAGEFIAKFTSGDALLNLDCLQNLFPVRPDDGLDPNFITLRRAQFHDTVPPLEVKRSDVMLGSDEFLRLMGLGLPKTGADIEIDGGFLEGAASKVANVYNKEHSQQYQDNQRYSPSFHCLPFYPLTS